MNELAMEFAKVIRDRYGKYPGKFPGADEKAMKIARLGVSFGRYVELAVTFGHSLAESKGWPYPYWGAVTGDWMIGKVADYLKVQTPTESMDGYECEMVYAHQWIQWYIHGGIEPERVMEVNKEVKQEVAQIICMGYGIEYVPSYRRIAQEINKRG